MQGAVQRLRIPRRADLDGGHHDGLCPAVAQESRGALGLRVRARHQHALSKQRPPLEPGQQGIRRTQDENEPVVSERKCRVRGLRGRRHHDALPRRTGPRHEGHDPVGGFLRQSVSDPRGVNPPGATHGPGEGRGDGLRAEARHDLDRNARTGDRQSLGPYARGFERVAGDRTHDALSSPGALDERIGGRVVAVDDRIGVGDPCRRTLGSQRGIAGTQSHERDDAAHGYRGNVTPWGKV